MTGTRCRMGQVVHWFDPQPDAFLVQPQPEA
jgi:hypothetical protein